MVYHYSRSLTVSVAFAGLLSLSILWPTAYANHALPEEPAILPTKEATLPTIHLVSNDKPVDKELVAHALDEPFSTESMLLNNAKPKRDALRETIHLTAEPLSDSPQQSPLSLPQLTLSSPRADDHAPIDVMGDHTHKKGEWMLSYRYKHMFMKGNRDGGQNIANGDVLNNFMVTPLSMKMDMHMMGVMVAPTNWMTAMVMVPYTFKSMDHRNRMGTEFRTRSEGFGDIKLSGLVPVLNKKHHKVVLKTGVSFPTGSINQRADTPAGRNQRLPYPMQIGSGTYDLLPGITYSGQSKGWSWGLQSGGTIRLARNRNDYRLGNRVFISPWLAKKWASWVSTSVRVNGQLWGNIRGADKSLNPRMVPTARPDLQRGKALDLTFGINLFAPKGWLKNQRLAVEMGFPLHQDLRGPQLKRRFFMTVGWQWTP